MNHLVLILSGIFISFLLSPAFAQSPQKPRDPEAVTLTGFLADGGVVNSINGETYLEADGQLRSLNRKQHLTNGAVIRTGTNGLAEILLNPGYYLRLSANTQVTFLDLSPDNLKIKVSKGSAIIEIVVPGDQLSWYIPANEPVTITTPEGDFATVKGGIYRFDVRADETDLKVRKGRSVVAGARVDDGMKATLRNGSATIVKFNRDAVDEFDNWSHERASLLVKSNKSLKKTSWHKQLRDNPLSYLNLEPHQEHQRVKERYVISAVGGQVRFVETGVTYQRGDSAWAELAAGVGLEWGDKVKTGPDGRAQILVYPNCYLHLASNTEIVYAQTAYGFAAVKLLRGSAVILTTFPEEEPPPVWLVTRQDKIEIMRNGLYRLNTSESGPSEMLIHEGRVKIAGLEIKTGKRVVLGGDAPVILPLQNKALDSFDVWSTKGIGRLSESRRVQMFGMWFFDDAFGAYTYVPGLLDFHSPYGGRYAIGFLGRWH